MKPVCRPQMRSLLSLHIASTDHQRPILLSLCFAHIPFTSCFFPKLSSLPFLFVFEIYACYYFLLASQAWTDRYEIP